jgi:aspartyl-tRNA(Asn)/glutamyl-tRNA(Gln) amidotransferase subunit C
VYHCCPLFRLPGGLRENPEHFVSLTKDQVQHIATLARLQVADAEFDDVVDKLSRIVDFVDQLQAAATDDVLPMAHPLDMAQRLRADEVTEPNEREELQKNAPSTDHGYYLVPKVIE